MASEAKLPSYVISLIKVYKTDIETKYVLFEIAAWEYPDPGGRVGEF